MSAKKSRSLFSIIAISFMAATFSSPISTAAVAQNNDANSMDPMFNENDAKKQDAGAKKTAAAQDTDAAKGADSDSDANHSKSHILGIPRPRRKTASTPLTSIEAFARSPIILGSSWPGVGPFKPASDESTLVDASEDTLKMDVGEQKQVRGVELKMNGTARDFLGVEMTADFLLEALGTRPARIADFNASLEKARLKIFGKTKTSATIAAGRYAVVIRPNADDPHSMTIKIDNVETAPETASSEQPTPQPTGRISKIAGYFKNLQAKPGNDDIPSTKPGTKAPSANSSEAPSKESLNDSVKSLIENWQKIKRNAVKERDITQLSDVLTGHALSVQTNGIKWLSTNHKYYEMVPRNVAVSSVTEIEKGKKFSVVATVKESSKLYEEQTNKLLRDGEDTYLVNYTVEKQGDKFLISDSSIIKNQTPNQAPQDASKKR